MATFICKCIFYCKKGRHRSVAVAFVAVQLLSLLVISDWVATETLLSDHSWAYEACIFCRERNHPSNSAAQARQFYVDTADRIARAAAEEVQREI